MVLEASYRDPGPRLLCQHCRLLFLRLCLIDHVRDEIRGHSAFKVPRNPPC